MFINDSNLHYITSNEWIGKLVEEVVVAYFKELPSICLGRQSRTTKVLG
jgi:hypothetical protein